MGKIAFIAKMAFIAEGLILIALNAYLYFSQKRKAKAERDRISASYSSLWKEHQECGRIKDALRKECASLAAEVDQQDGRMYDLLVENNELKEKLVAETLKAASLQAKLDAKPAPVEPKIIKAKTAADVRRIVEQTNALDEVNPDGIR